MSRHVPRDSAEMVTLASASFSEASLMSMNEGTSPKVSFKLLYRVGSKIVPRRLLVGDLTTCID